MSWAAVGVAGIGVGGSLLAGMNKPKLKASSNLSPEQRGLLGPLSQFFSQNINAPPEHDMLMGLLSGHSDFLSSLSDNIMRKGILAPALYDFQQNGLPSINEHFAGLGGSLSSRRNATIGNAVTGIYRGAESAGASILPQLLNSAIGGLSSSANLGFLGAVEGSRFALQPTMGTQQAPAGMGWNILSDVLKGGATYAAAGGFGGGGNAPVNTGLNQQQWAALAGQQGMP